MNHFSLKKNAFIFAAILGAAVSLVSCKMKTPETYEGTWVVTDARLPGITAMSKSQADTWLGKSFSYDAERAQLAQESCLAPTYERDTLDLSAFKTTYKVSPDALDFKQGDITRIQLQCNGGERMPGQTLLMQESIVTYLIWDGVFFTLEKSNDDTTPAVASL